MSAMQFELQKTSEALLAAEHRARALEAEAESLWQIKAEEQQGRKHAADAVAARSAAEQEAAAAKEATERAAADLAEAQANLVRLQQEHADTTAGLRLELQGMQAALEEAKSEAGKTVAGNREVLAWERSQLANEREAHQREKDQAETLRVELQTVHASAESAAAVHSQLVERLTRDLEEARAGVDSKAAAARQSMHAKEIAEAAHSWEAKASALEEAISAHEAEKANAKLREQQLVAKLQKAIDSANAVEHTVVFLNALLKGKAACSSPMPDFAVIGLFYSPTSRLN